MMFEINKKKRARQIFLEQVKEMRKKA